MSDPRGSKETDGRTALADSHAHLDMPEFAADRDEVVGRAAEAGVVEILCPADLTSPDSLATILDLADRHPGVTAAAGVHPHQAKGFEPGHAVRLRALAAGGKIRAIGEIGLDFHYDVSPPDRQREALAAQLDLARELALPVILHSRKAGAEIVAAVDAAGLPAGSIMHCFTEDWDTARRLIERGFFISFSGILTFPKAGALRETARRIPPDRLLVETDSPYLAPVPHRGGRAEPAHVIATARVLAACRKTPFEEIAALTLRNYRRAMGPGT